MPRHLLFSLGILLASLGAACDGAEAAKDTISWHQSLVPQSSSVTQSPSVTPTDPESPEPAEQRILALRAGSDGVLRDWSDTQNGILQARRRGHTITSPFRPEDSGLSRMRIEGPFEPGSFDRVVVSLVGVENNNDTAAFRAHLIVGKKEIASRELRTRIRKQCTLTFDFPVNRSLGMAIDAIEIAVPSPRVELFHVVGVGVSKRAILGGWLPWPGGEAELLLVRGEWRRCRTLARSHPLEYELLVPPRAQLHTSIGLPHCSAWLMGKAKVTFDIRASDGGPGKSFTRDIQDSRPWRSVELDLRRWEGERIHLAISLQAEGEEAALVLEDPSLVRRGSDPARVLLITSDTHRADHMGYVGNRARTPFLDKLAEKGASFLDCYSSAQTTSPSHASLMTGLTPLENGVIANGYVLDEGALTLAEQFRAAGYQTWAAVSVVHLAPDISGLGQGFQRFSAPGEGQRDSSETWETLDSWLDDAPDAPLFVWLHLFDAHGPYDPPADFKRGIWKGGDPRDPDLAKLPDHHSVSWDRSLRDAEYIEALYRAEVHYVDDQVRRVMKHRELENALLALTADHGEVLRSREDRVWFEHSEMLMDTLQVPLLLHGPGVAALRSEEGVQQIDLGRTLLDLAGIGEATFPGQNLLSPTVPSPRFGLGNYSRVASVRLGRWHLNLRLQPERLARGVQPVIAHEVELFDVHADPASMRDLAEVEIDACVRLRQMLVDWLTHGARERLVGNSQLDDAALVAQLEALGYAQGAGAPTSELWDPDCTCEPCEHFRELERRTTR